MLAATVDSLPAGRAWCYEPKWDGWRAVAFRQADRVVLHSRSGKPLGGYFPEITRPVREHLPAGVVLDGELIVWRPGRERTSFADLQRRVTAGRRVVRMAREHPAHYVIFDVLADSDGPMLHMRLDERRRRLEALLVDGPPQLALCPQTTDLEVAREWLSSWTAAGVEGVVAKRLDSRYEPGRRGWRKLRSGQPSGAAGLGTARSARPPSSPAMSWKISGC
jgi:ATP-dependent DNA ligase